MLITAGPALEIILVKYRDVKQRIRLYSNDGQIREELPVLRFTQNAHCMKRVRLGKPLSLLENQEQHSVSQLGYPW